MKQLIQFTPTFTPGNAGLGTLDFSAYPGFALGKLYAVINVTQNSPLYIPGTPQYGYSGLANTGTGTVITLTANTSAYAATDTLQVFYDVPAGATAAGFESNFAVESGGNLQSIADLLKLILIEIKINNYLLEQGFYPAVTEDVERMRTDLTQFDTDMGNQGI